jgi:plasmid stabilization system protein ParE
MEDSPDNAIRVSNRIANIINMIPDFPEMYKADELKTRNDGSFRTFVQDRIRITYRIMEDTIRIERVRHTSQEPIEY